MVEPIKTVTEPVTTVKPVETKKESYLKIPLPWQQKYVNNQLVMFLDVNEFYSLTIPTGFYCLKKNGIENVMDEESKTNKEELIFTWKKKKIPIELLYSFIRASARVYKKYKSEFAACIFYDTKSENYELLIPYQTISGCNVTYNPADGFDAYQGIEDKINIVDMHSHHIMNVGFSATDDHSDSVLGAVGSISLIIKSIDKFNFLKPNENLEIRLTIQGQSYYLSLSDVFDTKDPYYKLAKENFIEEKVPIATVTSTNASYASMSNKPVDVMHMTDSELARYIQQLDEMYGLEDDSIELTGDRLYM